MNQCHHTSSLRIARRIWIECGGSIVGVRRTGEVFYIHPLFERPLRVNNRRNDVCGKLMTRLNQVRKANTYTPSTHSTTHAQ